VDDALLETPFSLLSLRNVLAEFETRTDTEPHGPAAILQQIAEEVVVDEVRLYAKDDMLGKKQVSAATESIEHGPVGLLPQGRQLRHDGLRDRIRGLRGCDLLNRPEFRSDKQRHFREVAIRKLRTAGKGLCSGMSR